MNSDEDAAPKRSAQPVLAHFKSSEINLTILFKLLVLGCNLVMTIAFGINLDSYAILAADTRTTWYVSGIPYHDDESPKVQSTTMGLITGAGFLPLLDAVKRSLADETITNTNRLLAIIQKETSRIREEWEWHPKIDTDIAQTGWIFTYYTILNDESRLRVGIFHPSVSRENLAVYEVGQPAIICPVELDRRTVDAIYSDVSKRLITPTDDSQFQKNLKQNISIIADVVRALQPRCPSISKRLQFGIHKGDRRVISSLVDLHDATSSVNINLEQSS